MRVRWFGQSAFLFSDGAHRVFIDPFGLPTPAMAQRGIRFDYPPISGVEADLLLITHEHVDHNAAEAVGGSPAVIRSTAGTLDSPVGRVIAAASEHDAAAGTQRGPNTIFVFDLDGFRVCHFGDFGQAELRPEQAAAIGRPDMLVVPIGGGPTAGAALAAAIARRLQPRWVVPMHYRTPLVGFLEPADAFLAMFPDAVRLPEPEFDTGTLPGGAAPQVVVPAPPGA